MTNFTSFVRYDKYSLIEKCHVRIAEIEQFIKNEIDPLRKKQWKREYRGFFFWKKKVEYLKVVNTGYLETLSDDLQYSIKRLSLISSMANSCEDVYLTANDFKLVEFGHNFSASLKFIKDKEAAFQSYGYVLEDIE